MPPAAKVTYSGDRPAWGSRGADRHLELNIKVHIDSQPAANRRRSGGRPARQPHTESEQRAGRQPAQRADNGTAIHGPKPPYSSTCRHRPHPQDAHMLTNGSPEGIRWYICQHVCVSSPATATYLQRSSGSCHEQQQAEQQQQEQEWGLCGSESPNLTVPRTCGAEWGQSRVVSGRMHAGT